MGKSSHFIGQFLQFLPVGIVYYTIVTEESKHY